MNERIRELYRQSCRSVFDYGGSQAASGECYSNYKTVLDYEKFAILVRNAALEEAAEVCEEAHELMNSSFQGAADAIRKLKEPK